MKKFFFSFGSLLRELIDNQHLFKVRLTSLSPELSNSLIDAVQISLTRKFKEKIVGTNEIGRT